MPSLNQNVAFQAKWYVPKQKFMSQTNRYWKKIIPGSKNWDGKSLQIEWVQRWPSYSLETLGNYTQVISILTGDFVKILRLFRPPPFFLHFTEATVKTFILFKFSLSWILSNLIKYAYFKQESWWRFLSTTMSPQVPQNIIEVCLQLPNESIISWKAQGHQHAYRSVICLDYMEFKQSIIS